MIKSEFNAQKLKEIDDMLNKQNRLSKEFEIFRIKCHKFVKNKDLEDVYSKIGNFVKVEDFNEMKKDLEMTVNKEEFKIL